MEAIPEVITNSVTQVRQPVYQRSVARWKNYQTELSELFRQLPMKNHGGRMNDEMERPTVRLQVARLCARFANMAALLSLCQAKHGLTQRHIFAKLAAVFAKMQNESAR